MISGLDGGWCVSVGVIVAPSFGYDSLMVQLLTYFKTCVVVFGAMEGVDEG